jgi:hypothetical protein
MDYNFLENGKIKSINEAVVLALALAITAPTDEQAKKATIIAESLSQNLSEKEIEMAKMASAFHVFQNKIIVMDNTNSNIYICWVEDRKKFMLETQSGDIKSDDDIIFSVLQLVDLKSRGLISIVGEL